MAVKVTPNEKPAKTNPNSIILGNQLALSDCGAESEGKWLLTWHEDIRPINHGKKAQDARKECWDGTGIGNNIGFWECHTQGGNQLFKYIPDKHQIFHVPSNGCATADKVSIFYIH